MSFAASQLQAKLRALAEAPPDTPVPSPCISVCQMHEATGLCAGCFRTLDEITAWRLLDDDGKREVWGRLGERSKGTR